MLARSGKVAESQIDAGLVGERDDVRRLCRPPGKQDAMDGNAAIGATAYAPRSAILGEASLSR
jgi:hypothetical protein